MEKLKEYPPGTIENPIVDSKTDWQEALSAFNPEWPLEVVKEQELADVLYYSFDNKIHKGQIIVNEKFAKDIKEIFELTQQIKFPIEKVIPISAYGWNDDASMEQNNTSGFNYRKIAGSEKLSNHSHGLAIDINPRQNPYIRDGKILPKGASYNLDEPGTLAAEHPVVKKFKELGWIWGGDWSDRKDYQHFEKILP